MSAADAPAHAPLAPSSAHIWGPEGCSGSPAMQAKQPPQEPTEDSREGDAAHWLLAQTLLKLTVSADAIAPNGVPINDEMRDAIVEMVDDVNGALTGCQPGDYYQIEQRVPRPPQMPEQASAARLDAYFVQHSRKKLHIWEFKFGHRFVDAYRNWQMIDYALYLVEHEKITDWKDWTFTLTIAQPRCFERDELGGSLREWFVSGADLAPLIADLSRAAYQASSLNAPLHTGEHCRDCLAQWDCAANQRMGGAAVDLIMGQGSVDMHPAAVGLEARTLALAMDRVKARLSALDAQALAMLNRGQNVPYHQIDWTKPRLGWDKTQQATAAGVCAMFGMDVQLGVDLPTPGQCIKQGIDETVIAPYTTRNNPSQKLKRVETDSAAKVLGVRRIPT